MRKIAEHLASIANPNQEESNARQEVQRQGTEKGHEGDEVTVTARETGRSSTHVFVTGFFPDGREAYLQMIPVADFNKTRFTGQFPWGRKGVIDV